MQIYENLNTFLKPNLTFSELSENEDKNTLLGIYAFNSANLLPLSVEEKRPLKALLLKEVENPEKLEKRIKNRLLAYTLKYISADILNTIPIYSKDEYEHCRLWHCGRTPRKFSEYIDLVRGSKGKVFFSGLQHCAGYWVCPICVYKIEEQRVNDIYDTLMEYRSNGFNINMVTLTIPHYKSESLKSNMDLLIKMFDSVRKHRDLRKYTVQFLRSLEIKYGKNGFHPHLHIVFPIEDHSEDYFKIFNNLWLEQLKKNDKKVVPEYAYHKVKWDDKLDTLKDYLCKWDIGDEVVKGMRKKGHLNNFTPFEILELIANGEMFPNSLSTTRTPTSVFKEYATDIFHKRQLQASRKFWLVKNMKSDAELCVDDKIDEIIYRIGYDKFLELGRSNKIHEVISMYEKYGVDGVDNFLINL